MLDETSKYLIEDPEIYSYDTHYDDIKNKREELEAQKKQQKVRLLPWLFLTLKKQGSKYINNILKASEKRKVEQSMIYEKIAEKELQREGKDAGGEKYVTAS